MDENGGDGENEEGDNRGGGGGVVKEKSVNEITKNNASAWT